MHLRPALTALIPDYQLKIVNGLADASNMALFSRDTPPDEDSARLTELCSIVDHGIRQFHKVGLALEEIRDRQLYRLHSNTATFAAFCQDRWNMSDRHADRLIAAANLCRELGKQGEQIKTERQAREVLSLPKEERVPAIEESKREGTTIAAAVRRRRPDGSDPKRPRKQLRFRLPGGTVIIEPNKRFQSVEEIIGHLITRLDQKDAA